MARTDANPPMPEFATDYVLQEVDPTYLTAGGQAEAVPPHRPGRVHPLRGLRRHLPVEVHPHALAPTRSTKPVNTDQPGDDPDDHVVFVVDEDVCTRCALCVDRCPTGVIILGKVTDRLRATATPTSAPTDTATPTASGSRAVRGDSVVADNGNGNGHRPKIARARSPRSATRRAGSQAWTSIFRPGSIFRKGYTDSPRNRSYVIMNNVLYHLHPVKVKRHAVKVCYTLCLGGLSLLPVHPAHRHRHLPDVLLPADRGRGVARHPDAARRRSRSARSCATCTDGPRTSWCCPSSCTWRASSTTAPTSRRGSSTG